MYMAIFIEKARVLHPRMNKGGVICFAMKKSECYTLYFMVKLVSLILKTHKASEFYQFTNEDETNSER